MFSKMKAMIFLFGIFFIVRRCNSQIPETTVAQYHYTIFKIFFDAALGPDAKKNSKTCPGICMPSSTAVFCPKVLDDMKCFTPNTKCCVRRNGSEPADPHSVIKLPNLSLSDITGHKSGDKNALAFNASDFQNDSFTCPGHCVLHTMQSTCESPAVIIPNTSNCANDTICCDDTRIPVTPKPTKRPRPTQSTTTGTFWSNTSDGRRECPGVCIANLVRFTCYGNAEITDLFKCRRSTTSCCANKELVHETLAQLYLNQPAPPHGHDTLLSHGHDGLQKYGDPEDDEKEQYSCPGVCVADHFSGYCEAYLSSNILCEPGSRCCVSRDVPSKPATDSRIITKTGQSNLTLPANPVQIISMIINSERSTSTVKPTKAAATVVETESKEPPTSQSVELTTPQLAISSSTDSSSTESSTTVSSKIKKTEETTAKMVETKSKEDPTLNTIELTTSQSIRDEAQNSTESTSIVAETKLDHDTKWYWE